MFLPFSLFGLPREADDKHVAKQVFRVRRVAKHGSCGLTPKSSFG